MNNFILKSELKNELENRLMPFWSKMKDEENGGFYGFADFKGNIDKKADKGTILQSRILWFFSSLYKTTKLPQALECANHAFKFIAESCYDSKNGGLFWSVDYTGKPVDDRKHTYSQSFGIYALAEYYISAKNQDALNLAVKLFNIVEEKCKDDGGYLEEFDREWHEKANIMLSEHDVISRRTMNTDLHLLEAYTTLYYAVGDEKVGSRLNYLLKTAKEKIYNGENNTLKVFFDHDWNETLDIRSYGHEIEASWLIDRASEALHEDYLPLTLKIADGIYRAVYSPDGIVNETVNGITDRHRVWWVQNESVIGFFNAYRKTGDKHYLDAAYKLWSYICGSFLDETTKEWFSELDEKNRALEIPVVSQWKCPYHNGRMCMEVIKMIDGLDGGSAFKQRRQYVMERYNKTITEKNHIKDDCNGIFERYENPVLTRESVPPVWRYDFDEKTNPFFEERMGINAVFNPGAIEFNHRFCLVARIEGSDRKSFFGVAESDNGIDGFKFRDLPIVLPKSGEIETNTYDMRLTRHEDGWIYGVYCAEHKDPDAPQGNYSSAIAQAAVVRTHDLKNWERLPYLKTPSPQQRNVVLHPEFVGGKYCFYTRPMDSFIESGSGSGICIGYCEDIMNPVIEKETVISKRRYHTITESKNGEGCVPIKTPMGWIHIAHGVRNTAAGLRYVIYLYVTALDDIEKVIAEPGGYLIAPFCAERIGDVSNVVFTNGAVACDNGEVFLYYASSDTRVHVATTTIDRLLDYAFNTPTDPLTSADCVLKRIALIKSNEGKI